MTKINGGMVNDSVTRTVESAGALDGRSLQEMSLISIHVCAKIAIMLNQIAEGAP